MSQTAERDYVLGTHDEEIARLGLQHRVWRPVVLECWQKAGITVGSRVLDVGAGPGYATVDLAEIVGQSGGEPDSAPALPALLLQNGFVIRSATPQIFCIRPDDAMWQWPAQFIDVYLARLLEQGRIDQTFAEKVRAELAAAEKNPNAL